MGKKKEAWADVPQSQRELALPDRRTSTTMSRRDPRDSMHSRDSAGPSGDEDEDDEFEEQEPQVERGFKHAIIVDGLPVVPAEKRDKLCNVVRKFFSQVGTIIEDGLEMPVDSNGKSQGCAFFLGGGRSAAAAGQRDGAARPRWALPPRAAAARRQLRLH